MTESADGQFERRSSRAERAFAEYLRQHAWQPDLTELQARHPVLAAELRQLFHDWQGVRGVLDELDLSRSLSERIVRRFGKSADPGVALEAEVPSDGDLSREFLERIAARQGTHQRYRLKGELARGGMGAVLHVWDEDLRRPLAMKVALDRPAPPGAEETPTTDQRRLSRFLEEAQVTGQLDHPGIVPVHELGLDAWGRPYFTMRLVRGMHLGEIFKLVHAGSSEWTHTRVLGVLLKVCEAMAYAHSKGVIHRDLKPVNIMVGRFGQVYVMDWGLARVLGRADRKNIRLRPASTESLNLWRVQRRRELTQATGSDDSPIVTMDGDVVGTPSYMPPEQADGRVELVGPRSDVYAAGAMLYHLTTGLRPYHDPGEHPQPREILIRVTQGPPKRLQRLVPGVSAELAAICEKAMAREPEDRYASMDELHADLRAYLEHRVVRAFERGRIAELKKWVLRRKTLTAAILTALLFIAFAGWTGAALKAKNRELDDARAGAARLVGELRGAQARERALWLAQANDLARLRERALDAGTARPDAAWLAQGRQLVALLPAHRTRLAELRAEAGAARTEAERAGDVAVLERLVSELERFAEPGQGLLARVERELARGGD